MLAFLRPFCNHKNERLVYVKDRIKIYYCPDCHKYQRLYPTDDPSCYIAGLWNKRLGDIAGFTYVGEEK